MPDYSLNGEGVVPIRGYLLHIAEQHLAGDLHAKGGASDLVQTALLAAHVARDQFRGDSPEAYKGWVRRILLNVLGKFRRHWRRCRGRDVSREVPLDQPTVDLGPARHDTPSHLARRCEQHDALAAALADLPEDQRRAVALRIDHGLSFVEIGQRIGKSADAARMLYNRALERLQAALPLREE
jgi:RNA polymerase sigma-70 factor (ECF subfamily)